MDNTAYRSINRVGTLAASQHLRRLRDIDLLEMKGRGNRTYYVPGTLMLESLVPENAPAPPGNAPAEAELQRLLAPLPIELRHKLPGQGRRRPRDAALRELVRELCGWQSLSARELTILLRPGMRNIW